MVAVYVLLVLVGAATAIFTVQNTDPVVISVTTDHRVFIEAEELSDEKFEQRMREKLAGAPGRKILLKGDTSLEFEHVRKVMQLSRNAGAKGISLGVEEIKK